MSRIPRLVLIPFVAGALLSGVSLPASAGKVRVAIPGGYVDVGNQFASLGSYHRVWNSEFSEIPNRSAIGFCTFKNVVYRNGAPLRTTYRDCTHWLRTYVNIGSYADNYTYVRGCSTGYTLRTYITFSYNGGVYSNPTPAVASLSAGC